MDFLIFAIHLLGISSILASINIIVTLLNMRAPGMPLFKMPMFCWTWLVTAFLLILVVPVLAGGVTMLLFDRHFGTSFFNAAGGGDPVLFQHLFWFFGHPEVYILLLPSIGVLSHVIPTFARKPLFGYPSMVGAMLAVATIGMVVWAHHQYTIGMSLGAVTYFMIGTIIISIPVGLLAAAILHANNMRDLEEDLERRQEERASARRKVECPENGHCCSTVERPGRGRTCVPF